MKANYYLADYRSKFWIMVLFWAFPKRACDHYAFFCILDGEDICGGTEERWQKIHVAHGETDSPQSHPEGFVIKGKKRKDEEQALIRLM